MSIYHDKWDLTANLPPADLSDPLAAMWWIGKGNWQTGESWEKAHELCQRAEGTPEHDWVHALLHWIEGDEANSGYWYRRAQKKRASDDAREEWRHILNQFS